jgi:hypothetical protein
MKKAQLETLQRALKNLRGKSTEEMWDELISGLATNLELFRGERNEALAETYSGILDEVNRLGSLEAVLTKYPLESQQPPMI